MTNMTWMLVNPQYRAQQCLTNKGIYKIHRNEEGKFPLKIIWSSGNTEEIYVAETEDAAKWTALRHLDEVL